MSTRNKILLMIAVLALCVLFGMLFESKWMTLTGFSMKSAGAIGIIQGNEKSI